MDVAAVLTRLVKDADKIRQRHAYGPQSAKRVEDSVEELAAVVTELASVVKEMLEQQQNPALDPDPFGTHRVEKFK